MPVKSDKQRRFMYASLAGKTDVPPSVAKKFVGPKAHFDGGAVKETEMMRSDRPGMGVASPRASVRDPRMSGGPMPVGKGFAKGGETESKKMVKQEMAFMKKKGAPKSMIKHEMAEAKGKGYARGGGIESKGKTKGKMVKMAGGGSCK